MKAPIARLSRVNGVLVALPANVMPCEVCEVADQCEAGMTHCIAVDASLDLDAGQAIELADYMTRRTA